MLIVLGQLELWLTTAMPGPKGLTVPLAILIPASVAIRRRVPLAAASFAATSFAVLLLVAAPQTSIAVGVAILCDWYGLAVWTDTRPFLAGCGVVAVTSAVAQLGPKGSAQNGVQFVVIPIIGMLLARRAVRDRQLRADALATRAELLAREHELRTNAALAEERARIARELHDLVAHNVSVMVVQAGAERHALPAGQQSTRETLTSIEQAGRQALTEARRLLGMLRREGEPEQLEPQPSLDQLDFLVEQIQRAGLPVRLDLEGERVSLPAGVDLCAYRIVQEALTNALKHAGPARADVRIAYDSARTRGHRARRWTRARQRGHRRGGTRPDRHARARGAVRRRVRRRPVPIRRVRGPCPPSAGLIR